MNKFANRSYVLIKLGNLEAKRDWGYAGDYIKAMDLIINYPTAKTFVIATGKTRTVKQWCDATVLAAANALMLKEQTVDWKGTQENEIGYFEGEPLFVVAKEFYSRAEVDLLLGDASKARKLLGWKPETSFEEMVSRMFRHDLNTETRHQASICCV